MSDRRMLVAALLALFMAAPVALAQDSNNQDRGGENRDRGSDRGGDRRFDPSRMAEYMKEQMGANDEEWKVIEPKLTKVMDARRDQMSSMFGGRNRGGDSSNEQRSPMQTASRELRDVLENKDSTPEQINAKLTAFRAARDKSREALVTAQKELKEVLTARQEAVLVSRGMLD